MDREANALRVLLAHTRSAAPVPVDVVHAASLGRLLGAASRRPATEAPPPPPVPEPSPAQRTASAEAANGARLPRTARVRHWVLGAEDGEEGEGEGGGAAERPAVDPEGLVGRLVASFAAQFCLLAGDLPRALAGHAPPALEDLASCVRPAGPRPSPADPRRAISSPPCPRGPRGCHSVALCFGGAPPAGTVLMGTMREADLDHHERTGAVPAEVGLCWVCQVHDLLTFVTAVELSDVPVPAMSVLAPLVARVDSVADPCQQDAYAPDLCFLPLQNHSVGLGTPFPLLRHPLLVWRGGPAERGAPWRLDNSPYWGRAPAALPSPRNRFFR